MGCSGDPSLQATDDQRVTDLRDDVVLDRGGLAAVEDLVAAVAADLVVKDGS
jgi:hypothetical protein